MEDRPRKIVNVERGGVPCEIELRMSTNDDLRLIQEWLIAEAGRESHAGMLCNWNSTVKSHFDCGLLTAVDQSNRPVAYLQGALVRSGALHVERSWRRCGLEEHLVKFATELAVAANEMVLEVRLISQEEVQFWKTMGFHFVECDYRFGRNLVGQRVLSKRLDPLPSGRKVNVEIRSFDENKFWRQEDLPPETTSSKLGVEFRYGPIIQLAERLTIPRLVGKRSDRPAVEIFVDNRRVYFDMANGPGGERVGIQHCRNGYYIDQINL